MRKIFDKTFFVIICVHLCVFIFYSCNDKYRTFYHDNREAFRELVKKFQLDEVPTHLCCVGGNCLEKDVEDMMKSLNIECVKNDTVYNALIFTLYNQEYLTKVEYIYKYESVGKEIISYGRAGEKVEQITSNWYIRKIYFD